MENRKTTIEMITPQYLAGFLDGEGCITVYAGTKRDRTHHTPAVRLSNTFLPVLLAIRQQYGGSLYVASKKTENRIQAYGLTWSGVNKVRGILEVVKDFCIVKKAEIDFMLNEWLPGITRKPRRIRISDEELLLRQTLTKQLKGLKHIEFPVEMIN